jgi:putative DeoR family transcriptional regulator (stage III sporulation protein D)
MNRKTKAAHEISSKICGAAAPQKHGEVAHVKGNIEERACSVAVYIIENKATVRAAAKKFGISKSTVHKDLSERLQQYNRTLYLGVKDVLEENKAERHLRGGLATRRKYKGV